ncbi:MAG: sll1863 family stress response protein [Solirubrobacteraceae bacterium]
MVDAAGRSATADLAQDSRTFLETVATELRNWDMYLERMQVRAAGRAGSAREQAEARISELRGRRNALSQRLGELHSATEEGWTHVEAARDDLERSAAEVQAWFEQRREP